MKDKSTELFHWQLIETAPKDGSYIQLYRPDTQFVGYYGGPNSGWRINAPRLPAMWPSPTHWKRLTPGPDGICNRTIEDMGK